MERLKPTTINTMVRNQQFRLSVMPQDRGSQIETAERLDVIPLIMYCSYMDSYYSVKEASELLGLDTSHIRRLLAKGEIKGKKLGHDWIVLSLEYKRKRKPKRIGPKNS